MYILHYYNRLTCLQWCCVVSFSDTYEYNFFLQFIELVKREFDYLELFLDKKKFK